MEVVQKAKENNNIITQHDNPRVLLKYQTENFLTQCHNYNLHNLWSGLYSTYG